MMLHIETQKIIDKIKDLYPAWDPTATQMQAIGYKLRSFEQSDAEQAVLETYDPAKRTAPVEAILAGCRRIVSRRNAEIQKNEEQPVNVPTQEETDAIWAQSASEGNPFAMQWCDRHNIPYEKEEIPF